jgi:alpha-galactosidase
MRPFSEAMERNMQVTFIGAGSAVFSATLMADILGREEFKDATFSLMDIDRHALGYAEKLAHNLSKTLGAKARVRATTDRRRALEGSDFVVVTIRAWGDEVIRLDKEIPARYGVRQTVADTVGIGGIFYGLRHMPIILGIARDMEELCPNAWMLNYTNPMAMNTLAVLRGTKAKAVGLCHSVQSTLRRLRLFASLARLSSRETQRLLGRNKYPMHWPHVPDGVREVMNDPKRMIPVDDFFGMSAGINHMSAFVKVEWRNPDTARIEDAYPLIREAARRPEVCWLEPTRFEIFKRLGYYITESSQHLSEYVPHVMRHPEEVKRLGVFAHPPRNMGRDFNLAEYHALLRKIDRGEPVVSPDRKPGDEYASRIIHAIMTNKPTVVNGNIHNRGGAVISNLLPDCCVEVPCLVDRFGIQPIALGELPPQVAAMIRSNVSVQDLAVRAVLEANREHVYHAAMMDPNTAATLPLPKVWTMVDEMLKANRRYLPKGLAGGRR